MLLVVRVRNGRVYSIDSDGYGFHDSPPQRCESIALAPGLSKYRLLLMCGEPLTRKSFGLVRPLDVRGRSAYANAYETVYREEWVYNFGSRYLMRILRIENGRIVDVENGGRGYD